MQKRRPTDWLFIDLDHAFVKRRLSDQGAEEVIIALMMDTARRRMCGCIEVDGFGAVNVFDAARAIKAREVGQEFLRVGFVRGWRECCGRVWYHSPTWNDENG